MPSGLCGLSAVVLSYQAILIAFMFYGKCQPSTEWPQAHREPLSSNTISGIQSGCPGGQVTPQHCFHAPVAWGLPPCWPLHCQVTLTSMEIELRVAFERSPNSCDCSSHQVCISSYVFHFSLVDQFIDRLAGQPEHSHKFTSHKSLTPFQTCLHRPVDQFCWNCFSSVLCGSGSDTDWGAG